MQIRISLIPALGLNGVALVGECSLVRITCEDDSAVAQETYNNSYKISTKKVIAIGTASTLLILLSMQEE